MKRKKGFTLIELLVVIAIIALLMAILMPALDSVRKQAKAVICRTMLKQWGLMFNMYADQHDNKFMSGWTNYGTGGTPYGEGDWMVALEPMYGDKDIRFCPVAKKHGTVATEGWIAGGKTEAWGRYAYLIDPVTGNWKWAWGSMGANCLIYDYHPDWNSGSGIDVQKVCWRGPDVKNAGNIPMFADCACYGNTVQSEIGQTWNPADDPAPYDDAKGGGLGRRFGVNRHSGKADYTFLDWSVRPVGLRAIWRLKWHRNFPTDNPWVAKGWVNPWVGHWMENFPDE